MKCSPAIFSPLLQPHLHQFVCSGCRIRGDALPYQSQAKRQAEDHRAGLRSGEPREIRKALDNLEAAGVAVTDLGNVWG